MSHQKMSVFAFVRFSDALIRRSAGDTAALSLMAGQERENTQSRTWLAYVSYQHVQYMYFTPQV